MSSEAAALLALVRTINTGMSLAREFGVTMREVQRMAEKAEAEGRDLSVDDLRELADSAGETRDSLRAAIERAKEEGR